VFSFEQIKELIALVTEHGLDGIEVERSGFRLKIDGRGTVRSAPAAPAAPAEVSVTASPAVAPAVSAPQPVATEEPAAGAGLPAGAHVVKSPIVGTFYLAASPDADPYVKVGDRVERGQVLCIVEAMKLMNEIESDADGVVLEIVPANAQAVEFGEPLFVIQ
jgi:acetyl-CoA carboxylase biotin carboxyl carrier protein